MEPSILMNLTRGRMVHLLLTQGPASAPSIAAALSLSEVTVTREISLLSAAGIIRATGAIHHDDRLAYSVDAAQVIRDIERARLFFAPWL